jgi:hypothetical protein
MKDNKEESTNFNSLFAGIVLFLIGYGWFSFFEMVSGDTRWLVDLVGWFFLWIWGVSDNSINNRFFKRQIF